MSTLNSIVRPEVLALAPYLPADYEDDSLRLNANEAPWRAPGDDTERGLNIYPPPFPTALYAALATHWGVAAEQVLVTRGSSEAIDLLIRCFCNPGRDSVLTCPPTFGMYRVYAAMQGAATVEVPLDAGRGFALDEPAIETALNDGRNSIKLVFLCSPNNPTGNRLDPEAVARLCERTAGRALVVIDEAYIDFAPEQRLLGLIERHPHAVILRTLSKAHGLAGVRCGALIAHRELIGLVARFMPPYAIPTPSIEAALRSLQPDADELMEGRVRQLIAERERVAASLRALPCVERVFPSDANFLLLRATDPSALTDAAGRAGVLVRDFSREAGLEGCVRISIGLPEHNDRLLDALQAVAR